MTDSAAASIGQQRATAPRSAFALDGKVAVVSGGASGIGKSVVELLARQGARVFVLDSSVPLAAGEDAAAEQGFITPLRCDVTSASEVDRCFAEVERVAGRLDILVNNAGIAHIGNLEATSEADLDRVYAVNVKGIYHCLRGGIPLLERSGGGAIVNLASIAALVGLKDRFAYSMSKGAVLGVTLSVARDYLAKNIRCNCVCPARVHTPFVDGFLARHYPGRESEMFEQLSAAQPIGRMGTPDEVAGLILYLCSDEAAFVTGSTYSIDGGTVSLR